MDRTTDTTANDHITRIARTAWLCAFILPLALSALLLGLKSAQAAETVPAAPLALEEELLEGESEVEEENEAEFAAEECEIAEEEAAEGEITAAEAKTFCEEAKAAATGTGAVPSAAGKCVLRSVHAHVAIHHGRLKLTVGYTTTAPVTAVIQLQKGGTRLGSFKRQLGKSGVLRFGERLGSEHGRLVVRIKLPRAGKAGCPSRRLVLFPS